MSTDEKFDTAVKTASNLKSIIYLGIGLVAGAFGAGVAFKQQYDDILKAYGTVQALQQKKWGDDAQPHPRIDGSGTATCPTGSYVVGLTAVAAESGIGALILDCKFLNATKS
jgi:hypothetical protein